MRYCETSGFITPPGQNVRFLEQKRALDKVKHLKVYEADWAVGDIFHEVPARHVTDEFLRRYWDTFGAVFPTLDLETFNKKYDDFWKDSDPADFVFVVTLLLMISLGNSTYQKEQGRLPEATINRWWRLALAWQGTAIEIHGRHGCQLHVLGAVVLIQLVRQTYHKTAYFDCSPASALVRVAMSFGLHRDPSTSALCTSKADAENRRQLWYTILELDLESCLDAGTIPTIQTQDWDTLAPDSGNDEHVNVDEVVPAWKSLIQSYRTRYAIATLLNTIAFDPQYDLILKLHAELSQHQTRACLLSDREPMSLRERFEKDFLSMIYHRTALILHLPFSLQPEPIFDFSRNISLTSSIALLDELVPGASPKGSSELMAALASTEGAIFNTTAFYAALFLCLHLLSSIGGDDGSSLVMAILELRTAIIKKIECFIESGADRLTRSDFAGKTVMIPAMSLAYLRICGEARPGLMKDKNAELLSAADNIIRRMIATLSSKSDIPVSILG